MNEDKLLKTLRSLRHIEPQPAFTQTLRFVLLEKGLQAAAAPRRRFRLGSLGVSLTLASLILVASATFVLTPNEAPGELAGLNNEELLGELVSAGDINIFLYEISYNNNANERVNVALREVTGESAE